MTPVRERVYLLRQLLLIGIVGLIGTAITVVGFGAALSSRDEISIFIWILLLGFLLGTILCVAGAIGLIRRFRARLHVARLLRADEPLRGRAVPCAVSGHFGSMVGAIIGYVLVVVFAIAAVIEGMNGQLGNVVFMTLGLVVAESSARLSMRSWRESTRSTGQLGALQLVMDPFPGAIGGEFAAGLDISLPSRMAAGAVARLLCVSSSRSEGATIETVLWQSELPMISSDVHGAVRLVARFEVPAGLPPSEYGDPACEWRLQIEGLDAGAVPFTPTFCVEMQPATWRSVMFRPANR